MGGGWEVESRRVTAYQDGRSEKEAECSELVWGSQCSRGSGGVVSDDFKTENKTWVAFEAVCGSGHLGPA